MKMTEIPRSTLIYLIAIALLGGIYVAQETITPRRNTIPVPEISTDVDRIVMERDGGDEGDSTRLELNRTDEGWRVRTDDMDGDGAENPTGDGSDDGADESASRRAGGSYRADTATVEGLLRDVDSLSAVDVISTRGAYEEYGLAEGDTRRLRLFVGETQPIAIEFGGTAAAGDAVYGRINGSREIVLVPRSLASAMTTDIDEIRDTAVVRVPEERVTQVEIRSPAHDTVTLSRMRPGDSTSAAADEGDPVWRVEDEEQSAAEREADATSTDRQREDASPQSGGQSVARRVRDFFAEINPLRAQQFLSEDPEGEPFVEILIRRTGDRPPEEIRIWPPDEERRFAVRAGSADEAILVPEWRARRLLLGMERYFEPFVEAEAPATD